MLVRWRVIWPPVLGGLEALFIRLARTDYRVCVCVAARLGTNHPGVWAGGRACQRAPKTVALFCIGQTVLCDSGMVATCHTTKGVTRLVVVVVVNRHTDR